MVVIIDNEENGEIYQNRKKIIENENEGQTIKWKRHLFLLSVISVITKSYSPRPSV